MCEGFDKRILFAISACIGARGRHLIWNTSIWGNSPFGAGSGWSSPYVANRPTLQAERSFATAEWRAALGEHSIEMAAEIMAGFQFNADESEMRAQVQNLFARRF